MPPKRKSHSITESSSTTADKTKKKMTAAQKKAIQDRVAADFAKGKTSSPPEASRPTKRRRTTPTRKTTTTTIRASTRSTPSRSTQKSLPASTTATKTPTSTSSNNKVKKSKKEQLAEAQARAKEWAAKRQSTTQGKDEDVIMSEVEEEDDDEEMTEQQNSDVSEEEQVEEEFVKAKKSKKEQRAEAQARTEEWAKKRKSTARVNDGDVIMSEEEEEDDEDSTTEQNSERQNSIFQQELAEGQNIFKNTVQPVAKKAKSSSTVKRRRPRKTRDDVAGFNQEARAAGLQVPTAPTAGFNSTGPSLLSPPAATTREARGADGQSLFNPPAAATGEPVRPDVWQPPVQHPAAAYYQAPVNSPTLLHNPEAPYGGILHSPPHAMMFGDHACTYQQAVSTAAIAERIKQQEREAREAQMRFENQVQQDRLQNPLPQAADNSVEATYRQHSVVSEDEEELEEGKALPLKRRIKAFWNVALYTMAVVCLLVAYDLLVGNESSTRASLSKNAPPCFEPTPGYEDPSIETPPWLLDKGIDACVPGRDKERVPCPEGGICSNGFLLRCQDSQFMEPDPWGTKCNLNSDAVATLSTIKDTLMNLTVQYTCDLGCQLPMKKCPLSPAKVDKNKVLLFAMRDIQKRVDIDLDSPLLALNHSLFKLDTELQLIGLTRGTIAKDLKVPLSCKILHFAKDSGMIGWSGICSLAKVLFDWAVKDPLIAVSVVAFVMLVLHVGMARIRHGKFRNEVDRVRDLAHTRLQEQGRPTVVLMLRDVVANELYPRSRKERRYVMNTIWRQVVVETKRDHRIHIFTQIGEDGSQQDVWQWVAPLTPLKNSKKEN